MKSLKLLLILAPLLALAGCHGDASPTTDHFLPQQVVIADNLRGEISFSPIMSTYKGGTLHVEVPVESTNDFDISVKYRFTWFDDSRKQIDSPTGWQTMLLRSNTFETIVGDAPTSAARDFQLDLRLAQ
jgi:uncharacterized protein YcfL